MLWIGITGPMGSGKSTVGRLLSELGYHVADADQVVHELLRPGGPGVGPVVEIFGKSIINDQGGVDRQALGRVVFGDVVKLRRLEEVLHPLVRLRVSDLRKSWEKSGAQVAFYDVPLLFEKKMEKDFDAILVVTAPETVRKERFLKRTGLIEEEFDRRSREQLSSEEKEKRGTVVIQNTGNPEELKNLVVSAILRLKALLPAMA